MNLYQEIYPTPETVLEMEPEELAPFVLKHLSEPRGGSLNKYNFTLGTEPHFMDWTEQDQNSRSQLLKCLMLAWQWLEKEILIAPKPGQIDWVFITPRGRKILDAQDFETYQKTNLLPSEGLDPILVQKAKQSFIRGDYDTAVFQALKEVEIRVRKKACLPNSCLGINLMRDAFKPEGGVLADPDMLPAENQARMNLFAGSIGMFKNPQSHRDVEIIDPQEAADIIHIANHLLRVVDAIETKQ